MNTIDLVKKTEEESAKAILDAENRAKKMIDEAKDLATRKLENIQNELNDEINTTFQKAEKEAIRVQEIEEEKRKENIIKLEKIIEKNMNQAVLFIFNKAVAGSAVAGSDPARE